MALGARSDAVERAIEFHNAGGIVTFCWHWNSPTAYLKEGTDENGSPRWWGGFYTRNTDFDISKVMDGSFNIADAVLLQKWLLAVPDTVLPDWKAADLCEDDVLNVCGLCAMRQELQLLATS